MDTHKGGRPTVRSAVSILLGVAAAGRSAGPVLAQWLWLMTNWSKDECHPRPTSSLSLKSESQSVFQISSIIWSY